MAQAWSTWLPDVLPHVPGCPVLVAEHEIEAPVVVVNAGLGADQIAQQFQRPLRHAEALDIRHDRACRGG